MKRKAAIELSMNFLVGLIIGIALFSFGIYFLGQILNTDLEYIMPDHYEEEAQKCVSRGNSVCVVEKRQEIRVKKYGGFGLVINNILGIGEGVISLQFGMIPFIFRLAIEKGVFIFVGYAIFISSIYIKGFFYVKDKIIRTNMLLLLTGLIAIQLNYSSTNDPWIWFLFAMLFNAPLVIKRRTKVRPNFRTAT